jgi:hypothetical protein
LNSSTNIVGSDKFKDEQGMLHAWMIQEVPVNTKLVENSHKIDHFRDQNIKMDL